MMETLRSGGPPMPDATSHSLREMDQEMQRVLNRNDVDLEDKTQLYQQVLWRYLKRFDQYRNKPLGTVTIKRSADSPPATKFG